MGSERGEYTNDVVNTKLGGCSQLTESPENHMQQTHTLVGGSRQLGILTPSHQATKNSAVVSDGSWRCRRHRTV
ncbi:MAG: hypothetical protein LGR52_00395, partial [Candidatus Thiosymbion ectosymbiont of Robbea hypermnestra]|nr:hypothetical protein [Candidatus Thiosymbion ectosymbiont of Robbea hypermnestra]